MAKQDCDVALANGKLDAETFFLLAQSLEGLCRIESAEDAYRRALTLDPTLVDAKVRLQNSLYTVSLWSSFASFRGRFWEFGVLFFILAVIPLQPTADDVDQLPIIAQHVRGRRCSSRGW